MNNTYQNEEIPSVISNEYDYSNIVPTIECVTYLVQYCENVYKQFVALIDEDENRNKQFKEEYKNYNYKRSFGEHFEVYIREKSYNSIICKDFTSFKSAVSAGHLNNTNGLEIKIDLDYKRGKSDNFIHHENNFTIIFKPYEIKFSRKSTHNEKDMNQVENTIKDILSKFPSINSIFCTK